MDRLTVMKTLVAVVNAGSFAGGARMLGMSPSLVSRQIADLEKQVGVQLLVRTPRTLSLTAAGERYSTFCEHVIKMIEEEDAALLGLREQEAGPLAIVSPRWIGSLDVGDAIAAFTVAYPRITVRFELGGLLDPIFKVVGDRFDIAFHTKPLPDSSVMVRKVAELDFVICAAPAYLDRHGEPANPVELTHLDLLVNTHERAWAIGDGGHVQHYKLNREVFQSNSYLGIRKAAIAGLGIALLPLRSVLDDIRQDRLRILLPHCEVPARPLYALYPPARNTVRRVTLFLDFTEEWFRSHPMPSVHAMDPISSNESAGDVVAVAGAQEFLKAPARRAFSIDELRDLRSRRDRQRGGDSPAGVQS